MACILFVGRTITPLNRHSLPCSKSNCALKIGTHTLNFLVSSRFTCPAKSHLSFTSIQRSYSDSNPQSDGEEDLEGQVQDLRVPDHWLDPSKALEESEWLRETLHKWLDDEYCPEATNVEISKVAARSYYNSLLEMQTDLGEILLKMAGELESISYQESFHGAFSSANAACGGMLRLQFEDIRSLKFRVFVTAIAVYGDAASALGEGWVKFEFGTSVRRHHGSSLNFGVFVTATAVSGDTASALGEGWVEFEFGYSYSIVLLYGRGYSSSGVLP
ncbi:hypothetical protein F0562_021337 [Nyssa sinensis]|uniref:Uncharacterized protein n=1 Tax=Nyssa sinensis TaxID=561372 RepID=A0A5J5BKL1_9ASTE|nr:hypothetical protein F0562_021337 [Nyssa sinensis]